MIVSINQPAYMPWLGYFHRIARSDVHIVLDHVQFEKNSFVNRNKIRTVSGWAWLTVPIRTKGRFGDLAINSLRTAETIDWRRKHWQSLRSSYGRAPYFAEYGEIFESIYAKEWPELAPLMAEITRHLLAAFGVEREILYSSKMNVSGRKQTLVVNLCQAVGADVYLSGPLGRDYIDESGYHGAGIELRYHDYRHPTYTQIHGGFEPFMAAIDLLFNHGPDSAAILCSGQEGAQP